MMLFGVMHDVYASSINEGSETIKSLKIEGVAKDKTSGEILPGVKVFIPELDMETYTDFDGKFTFNGITPGQYNIVSKMVSYNQYSEQIDLSDNSSKTVHIFLERQQ